MKSSSSSPVGLYTVGIAALFLAGFFLLVTFGAQSYRNTVDGQTQNADGRALLSYLTTTAEAYDTAGAITVRNDATYGTVLVIEDGGSGYGLRIYCHEGSLVEDYAGLEAALNPDDAQTIGATTTFTVDQPQPHLLSVTTDAGTVYFRSRGGAL